MMCESHQVELCCMSVASVSQSNIALDCQVAVTSFPVWPDFPEALKEQLLESRQWALEEIIDI